MIIHRKRVIRNNTFPNFYRYCYRAAHDRPMMGGLRSDSKTL